jgi:hypothetical protein
VYAKRYTVFTAAIPAVCEVFEFITAPRQSRRRYRVEEWHLGQLITTSSSRTQAGTHHERCETTLKLWEFQDIEVTGWFPTAQKVVYRFIFMKILVYHLKNTGSIAIKAACVVGEQSEMSLGLAIVSYVLRLSPWAPISSRFLHILGVSNIAVSTATPA